MAQALPMVKKMIKDLVKTATKIPTWVLTTFNDPDVALVKKTKDEEELTTSLDSIKFGGGGKFEFKEQALKGTCGESLLGIHHICCSLRKVLFLPQELRSPWITCPTMGLSLLSLTPVQNSWSWKNLSEKKAWRKI